MVCFKIKKGPFLDDELKAVATLHRQNINLGFLSQLGDRFLFYLYKSMSECDRSILIVAKQDDDVVGFISGSIGLGPVFKHLLRRHFVGVSLALLPNMASLSKLKRIAETLLYSKEEDDAGVFPPGELLSLAVKDDFRRVGVAKQLSLALIKEFKKKRLDEFKIIVGEELLGAQKFYEKMGAVKVGMIEVHKGAKSFVYRLDI